MNQASRLDQLQRICQPYGVQIIYAFGSQARTVAAWLMTAGGDLQIPVGSDVDMGVKTNTAVSLSMRQKGELAIALEDFMGVYPVDLLVIDQVDPFVAANIVRGELLWAQDSHQEAEYQLYILRRTGDLAYLARKRRELILGV